MPQIAPAARARIWREMRLMPATSTMLGNITMSFTPTYCDVLPLASVVTMTFGNPIGNARMAAVPMAVPPPPPREITPSILFSCGQLEQQRRRAAGHRVHCFASIALRDDCREVNGCGGSDLFARDVGFQFRWFECADVDHQDFVSALANLIRDKGMLFAFGVHGSEDCDGGHGGTLARNREPRSRKK